MLPSLATVEELSVRIDVRDDGRAQALLDDASAQVRAYSGRSFVNDDGELLEVPDVIKTVVLQAAQRSYVNPNGYASEQIGQYSYRIGGGASGVYLLPHERQLITRAVGQNVHGIRTVVDGLPTVSSPTRWVEVEGDSPFPIGD